MVRTFTLEEFNIALAVLDNEHDMAIVYLVAVEGSWEWHKYKKDGTHTEAKNRVASLEETIEMITKRRDENVG